MQHFLNQSHDRPKVGPLFIPVLFHGVDFGRNTENGACAQERPVVQSLMRGSVHLGSRASSRAYEPADVRNIKKQTLKDANA